MDNIQKGSLTRWHVHPDCDVNSTFDSPEYIKS
jgi:hypothetical protein